jgi:hypothetical protein
MEEKKRIHKVANCNPECFSLAEFLIGKCKRLYICAHALSVAQKGYARLLSWEQAAQGVGRHMQAMLVGIREKTVDQSLSLFICADTKVLA